MHDGDGVDSAGRLGPMAAAPSDPSVVGARIRSTRPLAVVLAVVSIGALSGCTDDGVPDLDGPAVAARFADLSDDPASDPAKDRAGGDDGTDVGDVASTCPIDGYEGLLDATFDLVDDEAVLAALDGSPTVGFRDVGDGRVLVCGLADDTDLVAFVVTAPPPPELDRPTLGPADGVPADARSTNRFRGGLLGEVCASAPDQSPPDGSTPDGASPADPDAADPTDGSTDTCEVVWIDDDALVGVLVQGEGADGIVTTLVEERFRYTLPLVVDRFLAD